MHNSPQYTMINPSILIGELPLDEQLRLVAAEGFTEIELWWPFETASPSDAEVAGVLATIERHALALRGLNVYEGGMSLGNRGIACWPDADAQLDAAIEVAKQIGLATGCRLFNVLHGTLDPARDRGPQDDLAAIRTARAADALAEIGGAVSIEQLSHIPNYGLRTAEQCVDALARARAVSGAPNLGLQVDLFHLYNAGDDVRSFFTENWRDILHVQLADFPGRGGPGTGTAPLDEDMAFLRALGYTGRIALEYTADAGADPFGWMR
jgi:hydroxypyruvate isomerase